LIKESANLKTKRVETYPAVEDSVLLDLIVESIQDIKGKNIVKIDLTALEDSPTNYFIICEGDSSTQVNAITQNVSRKIKSQLLVAPNHIEGLDSKWMLVDYFDIVVHIFYPPTRKFYDLEDLWHDGKITIYEDLN
jgi:ribosome-associated protein